MITRQELEGQWKQIKGQIRERWGQLSDDELQQAHGDAEQLVGMIQQKTGQSRVEIEKFLDRIVHEHHSKMEQMSESAREYAEAASHSVQEGYKQMNEQFERGYAEAQQMVRSKPMESIIAAFGAGIISGVVVSLLLRPNNR